MLDPNGACWEKPRPVGVECDGLGDVGDAEPARLDRVIRPKRDVQIVCYYARLGLESREVGECARFGKRKGQRRADQTCTVSQSHDSSSFVIYSQHVPAAWVKPKRNDTRLRGQLPRWNEICSRKT